MTYYEDLGVTPEADEREIKKAYFRLVRKHPPEKDPEKFKLIREAYETLSDPQARSRYDSLNAHGDEIRQLMEQCDQHAEREEWDKAIRILKEVLVLAPEEEFARNALGISYSRWGQFDEALKVFETLTAKSADIPLYWVNYGSVWHDKAAVELDGSAEQRQCYENARKLYQKAHELEKFNAEPLVAIARTWFDQGEFDKALDFVKRAIRADGEVDFQDFEALFFMAIIQLHRQRLDLVEKVGRKIEQLLPPDAPDVQQYVAFRFAEVGVSLREVGAFGPSRKFFEFAVRLDRQEPAYQELLNSSTALDELLAEWDKIERDPGIIPELRNLLGAYLAEIFEDRKTPDRILNQMGGTVLNRGKAAKESVARLAQFYPKVYSINPEFFREVRDRAGKACFVVTAAYGTPDEPVIDLYRDFRESFLRASPTGRWLIRVYERVGPILARAIDPHPRLRRVLAKLFGLLAPWVVNRTKALGRR